METRRVRSISVALALVVLACVAPRAFARALSVDPLGTASSESPARPRAEAAQRVQDHARAHEAFARAQRARA